MQSSYTFYIIRNINILGRPKYLGGVVKDILSIVIALILGVLIGCGYLGNLYNYRNHLNIGHQISLSSPKLSSCCSQEQELIVAVCQGELKKVKNVLKKKPSLSYIDSYGKTALDYALDLHYDDIAWTLIKKAAWVTTESHINKVKQITRKNKFHWWGWYSTEL